MNQRGFTLLEVLVAVAVLGFLLVGLAAGTRLGLRAVGAEDQLIESRADLDATERILRRLIADADPSQPLRGTRGTLAFRATIAAPEEHDADIALGLDGRQRLVLRWTPHTSAQRLAPPPPAQEVELLSGIAGIGFSYWPASGPGSWTESWTDAALPGLVRLRVVFPPGNRRHWPDIVLAPMRRKAGS